MGQENRKLRILLVEDEVAIGEIVRAYLEREGYLVEHAQDGEEALTRAFAAGFDCILLDLNLPLLSGVEVFNRLRKRSLVPVIMVTTRGDEIDRIVGLELGADDYLAKP